MLDGVSLDQLRTFIAAVDEGSFSAAGRRLGRAQSVVSQTLATLEGQLGVQLFDRSARYPALTERGSALLPEARAVTGRMDAFKAVSYTQLDVYKRQDRASCARGRRSSAPCRKADNASWPMRA